MSDQCKKTQKRNEVSIRMEQKKLNSIWTDERESKRFTWQTVDTDKEIQWNWDQKAKINCLPLYLQWKWK